MVVTTLFLSLALLLGLIPHSAQPAPAPAPAALQHITQSTTVTAAKAVQNPHHRWAVRYTRIHASSSTSSKTLAQVPIAGLTLYQGTKRNGMARVTRHGVTGWAPARDLTKTRPKPLTRPRSFAEHAGNNVFRWCPRVKITTFEDEGGFAYATLIRGKVTEGIALGARDPDGRRADPNTMHAKATALHECAHLLQYRAYGYDHKAMERAMARLYPKGQYSGLEHMADCMSDVMGAKRTSTIRLNGGTYTMTSGYGGTCSKAQMAAARKLVAGQRL